MIITTPALAAAERLRARCDVRTHVREYEEVVDTTRNNPTPEQTDRLFRQIRKLLLQGKRQFEIAAELEVSRTTVGRHARAIARGATSYER